MLRVQGYESAEVYLLWGFTARVRIDELLRRRFGRSSSPSADIVAIVASPGLYPAACKLLRDQPA